MAVWRPLIVGLIFLTAALWVLMFLNIKWTQDRLTNLECSKNSDCPFITDRTCVSTFCNITVGRCAERTMPGKECSLDEQCVAAYGSPYYACNTSATVCGCYAIPECTTDQNCPFIKDRTCVSTFCNTTVGRCAERTMSGKECSLDEQCVVANGSPYYACNTSADVCGCYQIPQCVEDSDCHSFEEECITEYCINQTCIVRTTAGMQCSSNAQCLEQFGQYYQCELPTCSCIFAPPLQINFTCTDNEDCGTTLNPCTRFLCNGTCNERLNIGANCSSDEQCSFDSGDPLEKCDLNTCGCYRAPQCVVNSDCSRIGETPCVNYTCIDGTCVENMTAGAQCWTNGQCITAFNSSFYGCNLTNCMCAVSSHAPGFGSAYVTGITDAAADPVTRFVMGHGQGNGIVQGTWIFVGNWSGGVRVNNVMNVGALSGLTFANDTFTVTRAGLWNFNVQCGSFRATGGAQQRNWFWTIRKNASTANANQTDVSLDYVGLTSFATTSDIKGIAGISASLDCVAGDTIRPFAMMSLPGAGALVDISVDVFSFTAFKSPT